MWNFRNLLFEERHLRDEEILLVLDGEAQGRLRRRARTHMEACWSCRARRLELENTVAEFVFLEQESPAQAWASGRRAMLTAGLAQLAAQPAPRWTAPAASLGAVALLLLLTLPALWRLQQKTSAPVVVPDPVLTPGATVLISRNDVCRGDSPRNKEVPAELQSRVFAVYGIRSPQPQAYEVDYLITPALGGADDIRNLWPESYSNTIWNAAVKDALEDRLHDMVCSGEIDLSTAQREIARNWIGAYKKYFRRDQPPAGR